MHVKIVNQVHNQLEKEKLLTNEEKLYIFFMLKLMENQVFI